MNDSEDEDGFSDQATTSRSSAASKYATRTDDLFSEILTPYIVGSARNNTLIEITKITNFEQLKKFFASFNNGEDYRFYGALPQEKKYFQRTFIETCWDQDSKPYEELISTGLKMENNQIIKGYPSLDSEAQIARVTLTHLPIWYHPKLLREKMEQRFASFGTVLDVGFHFDCGSFMGKGYVVLNRNIENPLPLEHEINWDNTDGNDDWKVYLHWKDMPQYCRYCQKPDHCRADCAELLATKQCHNCNDHGHIARHCPRNNQRSEKTADKKVVVSQFTGTRKTGSTRGSNKSNYSSKPVATTITDSTHASTRETISQVSAMDISSATSGDTINDGGNDDHYMELSDDKKTNGNTRTEESGDEEREYKKMKASSEVAVTDPNTKIIADINSGAGGPNSTTSTPTTIIYND